MGVLYEVADRVATITLNRPEALNALNPESLEELNDAFQQANADPEVRVAILTGPRKGVLHGSDLKKTMLPKRELRRTDLRSPEKALSLCRHGDRQADDLRRQRLCPCRRNGIGAGLRYPHRFHECPVRPI